MSFLVLVLLSGCGSKKIILSSAYQDEFCQQVWAESEVLIQQEQVADNATVRVRNFPYLRGNRYLQALAHKAADNQQRHYVLEQMRQLDLDKRLLELSRVAPHPTSALSTAGYGEPTALRQRLNGCSEHFLQVDGQRPGFFEEVRQGLELDRDYSLWLRSVGLYPLTSLVVDYVAENAQEEMVGRLQGSDQGRTTEARIVFRPPVTAGLTLAKRQQLLRQGRMQGRLSLDVSQGDLLALVHDFAPMITVDAGNDNDRFGRIVRTDQGFEVDTEDPAVYYYFSHTLVQDMPALQINYAIWFPERSEPAPWFEQGTFDGLLFRVTLNWQGQPVFTDVAFQCGCYHFVLFNDTLVSGKLPDAKGFQPFVGGKLPELGNALRLHFSINSGWHQIGRVGADVPTPNQPAYQLLPYGELEYFQHGAEVLSLFDSEGRVPGSNRLERFFLFPMGIPKVGTMRQRGRQPITLIGRAYFDDPNLFDNAFGYLEPLPALSELLPLEAAGQQRAGKVLSDGKKSGEDR